VNVSESEDVPSLQSILKTNLKSVVASHASEIELQRLHYFRCYPNTPLVFAGLIFLAIVFWLAPRFFLSPVPESYFDLVQVVAICLFVGTLLLLRPSISPTVEGVTCPAIVLEPKSGWIAVYVDMSSEPHRRFVPAIKVFRVPWLKRATVAPLKSGDRLTTICVYKADTMTGDPVHYSDLRPTPVVCATRNHDDIERSLAGVPPREWRILETYTGLVPQPFEEDIHYIDLAKSTFFGPGERRLVVGYQSNDELVLKDSNNRL
jgi:hypothetical protein